MWPKKLLGHHPLVFALPAHDKCGNVRAAFELIHTVQSCYKFSVCLGLQLSRTVAVTAIADKSVKVSSPQSTTAVVAASFSSAAKASNAITTVT
jgi:hypothetical protein